MEKYLKDHYSNEITNLLNKNNERQHMSIHIDLCHLQQTDFNLFEAILLDAHTEKQKWENSLLMVQKSIASENDAFLDPDYRIKLQCHVRFVNFPPPDSRYKPTFPNNEQIRKFVEVKGNVVRMTQVKLLELKREYICSKCKTLIIIEAEYIKLYIFEVPRHCSNALCKGTMYRKNAEPIPKYCVDYQEIKIQDILSDQRIPPSLIVTLDNDLVDSCQPGDCVTICGTVELRWSSFHPGGRCNLLIVLHAISVTHAQKRLEIDTKQLSDQMLSMHADWCELFQQFGELNVRDLIIKSICPQVHGLLPVKLAIALAICSGSYDNDETNTCGINIRGQSHLLLIGDPGLAKSQLLLSASAIAPRSVHTTGMGCSTAGLTAAAIKEEGEWQLEAGALVLADGGICCIDEFNLMRESDRASIHEAMEQQKISMAKAGIVCKLRTRCAILAAANPKNLYSMSEPDGPSTLNIGIASPLLSRFDLVFILRDERNPDWDNLIADHFLNYCSTSDSTLWNNEKLQSHFAAVRNIHPRMSNEANMILGAYYKACRSDLNRDPARTSVRLLDSLNRLAEAHARLVFRETVIALDAVMVIKLMESSYGFGRILKPFDVIKEKLPLGPDVDNISEVYDILRIGAYINDSPVERLNKTVVGEEDLDKILSLDTSNHSPSSNKNDSLLNNVGENSHCDLHQSQTIKDNSKVFGTQISQNLTEMVSIPEVDSDNFDELLSQTLDTVESQHVTNQVSDENVKPYLERFSFNQKKMLTLNHAAVQLKQMHQKTILNVNQEQQSLSKSKNTKSPNIVKVRNRLLQTQSDDSDDGTDDNVCKRKSLESNEDQLHTKKVKISNETMNKLNVFQNKGNSEDPNAPLEDSAYHTFNLNDYLSNQNKTVVELQPPSHLQSQSHLLTVNSSQTNDLDGKVEHDEDLSFLDSIDI